MKKTLIIARHAHTYDAAPGAADFDRELTPVGRKQAGKSAEWLREQDTLPAKIVASAARRTQVTAGIFAEVLLGDATLFAAEKELYHASETEAVDFIRQYFTNEETLLIVGHNPTVTQLAIRLGAVSVSYLPPASVVMLSFDIVNWADLKFNSGKLIAKLITDEA